MCLFACLVTHQFYILIESWRKLCCLWHLTNWYFHVLAGLSSLCNEGGGWHGCAYYLATCEYLQDILFLLIPILSRNFILFFCCFVPLIVLLIFLLTLKNGHSCHIIWASKLKFLLILGQALYFSCRGFDIFAAWEFILQFFILNLRIPICIFAFCKYFLLWSFWTH